VKCEERNKEVPEIALTIKSNLIDDIITNARCSAQTMMALCHFGLKDLLRPILKI